MDTAPLGRLLVASGLLTQQALDEVLQAQKADGRRLGELLEVRGLVGAHQLAQFLSHQLACPWVSLQRVEVAREAVEKLPREIALKYHMVPVHLRASRGATALYVAMDDPTDEVALAEAARAATMPVKPMVALASEIRALLERLYGLPPVGLTPATTTAPPRSPSVASIPPPTITVKDAHDSSSRIPTRPPKPPPPRTTNAPPAEPSPSPPPAIVASPPPPVAVAPESDELLEEADVIDESVDDLASVDRPKESTPPLTAKIVVIDAPESFVESVRSMLTDLNADVLRSTLAEVEKWRLPPRASSDVTPCAFIVTEALYSTERASLSQLALDVGAQLLVSSGDLPKGHLANLLDGAIRRWRRSSYAKGTILEGRYELLRDLGGRLTGSRWEVRHLRTMRRSILKIGVRSAQDDSDAEAVRRELSALARMTHPGAVELRDAGHTDLGDPYIIVEMLEGRTLEGLVAARGALPPASACALLRQIALVLVAAHEAGVRHGDLRPENVLVARDAWGIERAKLIHWEAATVMDGDVMTNTAHDLAGLGACAFLALVGRVRREAEDVRSVGLAPKVADVIARAVSGRNRFSSAKDLLVALEAAAAELPSGAPPRRSTLELLAAKPDKRTSSKPEGTPVGEAPLPSELRRFQRAAYRTPVRVEVPSLGALDGRSEDISEGGLFLVTRGKLAEGTEVTVRFALPIDGRIVSESGVIRWMRPSRPEDGTPPRAMGVEFSDPSSETAKQIARYVSFMAVDSTEG